MKRFYKSVSTIKADAGYQVTLDGRGIKTALGNPQIVPGSALANALAQEWDKQGADIDPGLFKYRDLADFAIDIAAPDPNENKARLLKFLETDTLCYRADPDEPFFTRQYELWEPEAEYFEQKYGVTVNRISGIMHRPQPAATLAKINSQLARLDPFTLTALLTLSSLSASLIIGLRALENDADINALWHAANLEEDWQIEQWGADPEAIAVRDRRAADFANARAFVQLIRS